MELFDYIELFYKEQRRHSTLGQISPAALGRRSDMLRNGLCGLINDERQTPLGAALHHEDT
jgi:hypothetical protein